MFLKQQTEDGGSQTFLVGQQVEAMFVRSNLVTADGLYGRPTTINQPQYPEPGGWGGGVSSPRKPPLEVAI